MKLLLNNLLAGNDDWNQDPMSQNFLQLYFTTVCNKLECLLQTDLSSQFICLFVITGACPWVKHLKGMTWKQYTRKERPARDKHASYLQTFVNYGCKKFCHIWRRTRDWIWRWTWESSIGRKSSWKCRTISTSSFGNYFRIFGNYFRPFGNYFRIFSDYFLIFGNYFCIFGNYLHHFGWYFSIFSFFSNVFCY